MTTKNAEEIFFGEDKTKNAEEIFFGKETPKNAEEVFFGKETKKDYGLREDNTKKGLGYFGAIKTPDNKDMTELSMGVNLGGQEQLIPLIVPNLDKEELEHLRVGKEPTESIVQKAVDHAKSRLSEGKSQWATPEEEGKTPLPKKESYWDRVGKMFAQQTQIGGIRGIPIVQPEQAPGLAKDLAIFGIGEALFAPLKVLSKASPYAPKVFSALTRATEIGSISGAIKATDDLMKSGTLPSAKDLTKEAALWIAIDIALQTLFKLGRAKALNPIQRKLQSIENIIKHKNSTANEVVVAKRARDRLTGKYDVASGLEKIAKAEKSTPREVLNRNWEKLKKWTKDTFGKTIESPQNITPEETEKFSEFVEQEERGLEVLEKEPKVIKSKVIETKPIDIPFKDKNDQLILDINPEHKLSGKEGLNFSIVGGKSVLQGQVMRAGGGSYPIKIPLTEEEQKLVNIANSWLSGNDLKEALIYENKAKDLVYKRLKKTVSIEKQFDTEEYKRKLDEYRKQKEAIKPIEKPKEVIKPKEKVPETKIELAKQKEYVIDKVTKFQKNPTDAKQLKIKVPNDGTFTINNNPVALEVFKQKVEKIWKPEKKVKLGVSEAKDIKAITLTAARKLLESTFPDYKGSFEQLKITKSGTNANPYVARLGIDKGVQIKGDINKKLFIGKGKTKLEAIVELGKDIDKYKVIKEKKSALLETKKDKKAIDTKKKEKVEIKPQASIGKKPSAPSYQPRESEYKVPPRRSEMIELLRKAFKDPIRYGRIRSQVIKLPGGKKIRMKPLGIHKGWMRVTRLLKANDIATAAHEIGHNLHFYLYGGNAKNQQQLIKNVKKELKPFITDLKKYHTHDILELEGFANFIADYMLDRGKAFRLAPELFRKVESDLMKKNPEMLEVMDMVGSMHKKYLEATPLGRVEAHIAKDHDGFIDKIQDFDITTTKNKFITEAVDDLYPLKLMTAELFDIPVNEVENLRDVKNVYRAARLLKGNAGRTQVFLEKETYDFDTLMRTGEGLNPIIKDLSKREKRLLEVYLIVRRAMEKHLQGIETGIENKDAMAVYKELYDKYNPYAKRTDGYFNRSLEYYKDSGMLSNKGLEIIEEANKFYIPFNRDVKNKFLKSAGKKLQAMPQLKRMKGSTLDIIPPLQSTIINQYGLMATAEKNRVGQILVKLADSKFGGGMFVEKIPTPMKLVAKVSKEEIMTGVKKQLKILTDYLALPEGIESKDVESLIPDALNIFRPEKFDAGVNTITVWYNGKPSFYQVSPEIYKIWKQGFNRSVNNVLIKMLSLPARSLRAGAILDPRFIQKNIIRDTWGTLVFTKYKTNLVDILKGLAHSIGKTDLYYDWLKAGGGLSTQQSLDRVSALKHVANLGKYPKAYQVTQWLRLFGEIFEEANRLAEFAKGVEFEGTSRIGREQAAFAARDLSIDFAKMGANVQFLNAVTPFFNAHIQGLDKFYRSAKAPSNRPELLLRLSRWVVLPTILAWLSNFKDEDYKELSEQEKDQNMILKSFGSFFKIPITIEPAILVHGSVRRFLDYIYKKDPGAFDGYFGSIKQMVIPSYIPQFALPLIETAVNKDFFRGIRIIPEGKKGLLPELQYKNSTSLSARLIGRGLSYISPYHAPSSAVIDHFVNSWTGGLGRQVVNTSDFLLEKAGLGDQVAKPSETPLRRLGLDAFSIRYPRANTRSVEQFYDFYNKNKTLIDSLKFVAKEGDQEGYNRMLKMGKMYRLKAQYDAIQQMQKLVNNIYKDPNMGSKEKREAIDKLYNNMTIYARSVMVQQRAEAKK